jgi:hypothetical protein
MRRHGHLPGPVVPPFSSDPHNSAAKRAADWHDEMSEESYRTTIGRLIWRMGVAAVLAVLLLAALAFGKMVYFMVQEALVVMLLIAITVVVLWLFLVAFVLFQEGIRRAVLWVKTGIAQLALLSQRRVSPPDPTIPPPLQR